MKMLVMLLLAWEDHTDMQRSPWVRHGDADGA